jgi:hypothetical protein
MEYLEFTKELKEIIEDYHETILMELIKNVEF